MRPASSTSSVILRAAVLAASLALPFIGASAAPPAAPGVPVTMDGTLQVLVEDHPTFSRTRHFLRHETGSVELQLAGKGPLPRSGARLRVRGTLQGTVLALDTGSGGTALTVLAEAAATTTSGEQKVAVLLVNFVDDRTQPYTPAQATEVVFNQVGAFVRENSFQKTWVSGAAFGWYALPITKTCDSSAIGTAARQAATSAGVDLAAYGRIVYVFPENTGCGWAGSANLGGTQPSIWINGWLTLNVVGHELGHTFGLYHAHSLECGAATLGSACTTSEYGDTVDTMGNRASGHFDAFAKERLGWLNSGAQPAIATVAASGRYTIEAYAATPGGLPKALKIPRGPDPASGAMRWYYVEYRQPVGFDSTLATFTGANFLRGLVVRAATEGDGNSGMQLDVSPDSSTWDDWADAALSFGQGYTDGAAGVQLVAIGSNGASAQVDVTLTAAAACVRSVPLVALAGATQSAAPAGSVAHVVSVTNRDSAACGAAAFDLGAVLPAGWSGRFAAARVTLDPGASTATSWTLTVPAAAAAGTYAATARATNAGATAYLGATVAYTNVVAPATLAAVVVTDKAGYKAGETIRATASVSGSAGPIVNASVGFSFVKPGGATVAVTALTDASGQARASYRIARKDPNGAWMVIGNATAGGSAVSTTAAFTVQ